MDPDELLKEIARLRDKIAELEATCASLRQQPIRESPSVPGEPGGSVRSSANESREAEDTYRFVVENASETICITQDGVLRFVNRYGMQLVGYSAAELLSKPFVELVHPDDIEDVTRLYLARIREEHVQPGQRFRIIDSTGNVKWVESFSASMIWEGRPAVLSLIRDVTAQVQAEELLRQARDQLDQRVEKRTAQLREINEMLMLEIADREQAECALRESEASYRHLFEHSRDAIHITAQDGSFVDTNRSFHELSGYGPEEIKAVNARDLWLHPNQRSEWKAKLEREGSVSNYAWQLRRKDGQIRDCLLSSTVRLAENGSIQYQSISRDVTEQKRAEEVLRQSEEKYRLIFEYSPLGVFHFDSTGTITACNDNFVGIIGSSREKLIGLNTIRDLNDKPMIAAIEAALSGGMGHYEDYYASVTARKRTPVKCEFGPIVSRDGSVVGGIGIIEDITERKRAEEELRRSEEKYREMLGTITDGYHEADLKGNITLVNDSLCELMGYTREELKGMNFRQVMDELNAARIREAYGEVFRTGIPNPEFTYEMMRKDGATRYVSISISLARDNAGQPAGFRGILKDVTDRKRLEEQLRQAAKMEAVGQLAGGLAHDFNNILTALMGYANLLSDELPKDRPYQEKLRQITRGAERAADLTRQLLAFSRKQMLDVKVTHLNEIIADMERLLKRLISEHIDLATVLDPSAGMVQADPVQIQQILMNLAVNARDAMPEGGRLTIETANAFLDDDYCRIHPEVRPGPYVMFAVSDTGQGMDSQTLARIFEPFFTTKEKGVGTGLGLATVYGIVKQHQGHILVYSEAGRGTTFKVYLPRGEATADPKVQTWDPGPRPHGNETVLLVEDEEIVRTLASEALEILGYHTLPASDPREAIAICNAYEGTIHLLLSDVVLPQMDGRSLFAALSTKRPGLKVLYVSGYTENFIVHHGVLDKGVHFMHKPFNIDNLARKVRQILDSQ
ncbi:MAG: PAS domain S-box protein [Desulfomonile tiedjei]|nr:PAS domain S-box protein [Desulfomonile tiedjei]